MRVILKRYFFTLEIVQNLISTNVYFTIHDYFTIFDKQNQLISRCHRTVPSVMRKIFYEFLIFCDSFHEHSGQLNYNKI